MYARAEKEAVEHREKVEKRFLSILPLPLITTSLFKTGFSKSSSTCKNKSSLTLVLV